MTITDISVRWFIALMVGLSIPGLAGAASPPLPPVAPGPPVSAAGSAAAHAELPSERSTAENGEAKPRGGAEPFGASSSERSLQAGSGAEPAQREESPLAGEASFGHSTGGSGAESAQREESPLPSVSGSGGQPLEVTQAEFIPGRGLAFTSHDQRFSLALRLRGQLLYTASVNGEGQAAEHSFRVRRARLQLLGHVFGRHNKYKAELGFSPADGSVNGQGPSLTPLLDWYAEFDYVRDLTLRLGQYKVPFNRQRVISSGDLQLVDRAMAQGEFHLDRDIGMHLSSPDIGGLGLFKYYAGVWMNEGRDANELRAYDNMYIARLEVLPLGMFEDYKESDLKRHRKPALSLGAAYAFLDDASLDRGIVGSPPEDGGTTDLHVLTADVLFKFRGVSLQGEFYYRHGLRNARADAVAPARNGLGWFVQGGYLLAGIPLEVAARYSETRPEDADSRLAEAHEAGAGLSWYPGGHPLKLQADYFRTWTEDEIHAGDDTVRLQLQVAY